MCFRRHLVSWLVVIATLGPDVVGAQSTPYTAYAAAFDEYSACVRRQAIHLARTPESPGDIALAALAECSPQSAAFQLAYYQFSRSMGSDKDDSRIAATRLEESMRQTAVKAVFDVRYPK